MKLGFIGFGEVGFEMSKGFGVAGLEGILAYDVMLGDPVYGTVLAEKVQQSGVTMCPSAQAVLESSEVVIVAVPGGKALETAKQLKQWLKSGMIYADVSASLPGYQTKNLGRDPGNKRAVRGRGHAGIAAPLSESGANTGQRQWQ